MDYLEIARRAKTNFRRAQVLRGQLSTEEPAEDSVLSVEQWYPEFHRFHMAVVHETHDFDYGWLRQNRPELVRAIKAKENEIDALGAARLSQVMALLREWRELILTAEFERKNIHHEEIVSVCRDRGTANRINANLQRD